MKKMGAFKKMTELFPIPVHFPTIIFELNFQVVKIDGKTVFKSCCFLINAIWLKIPERGHQH